MSSWGGAIELPPTSPSTFAIGIEDLLRHRPNETVGRCVRVQRGRPLQIVVMGASVTAGCGAVSGSERCTIRDSWTHQLAERLRAKLADMPKRKGDVRSASVEVFGKNAITAA